MAIEMHDGLSKLVASVQNSGILQTRINYREFHMKMNSTIFKYNYEFHLEFKQLMKKLDLVLISFPKLLEKLFDNVVLISATNLSPLR